jgi:hypothetical protein
MDRNPDAERTLMVRSQICLFVLLGVLLLAQPVSIFIGNSMLQRFEAGNDTRSQWSRYVGQTPAPDVLFVGDSRIRADVDVGAISRSLSQKTGHRVGVAKLGISGAAPAFLDALLYRVAHTQQRPRDVVLAISEYQLNANYNPDPTSDFWQVSSPDVGYLVRAVQLDPNRGRLIRGWFVPVFANAQVIVQGVQCFIQERSGVKVCSQASRFPEDQVMNPVIEDYILGLYRDLHLHDYRLSQAKLAYLSQAIGYLRAAKIRVHLVIMPIYKIDGLNTTGYTKFENAIRRLAAEEGIGLTDLHHQMQADLSRWGDPSHLNHSGASEFGRELAAIPSPYLQ